MVSQQETIKAMVEILGKSFKTLLEKKKSLKLQRETINSENVSEALDNG